jgi:hypothetical protein
MAKFVSKKLLTDTTDTKTVTISVWHELIGLEKILELFLRHENRKTIPPYQRIIKNLVHPVKAYLA